MLPYGHRLSPVNHQDKGFMISLRTANHPCGSHCSHLSQKGAPPVSVIQVMSPVKG
jgi:hypothetical protein